jgi:hypothetical protein
MSESSILKFERQIRTGGGGKTERQFFDVLVDSKRLLDRVGWQGADLVTPFGWGAVPLQLEALRQLRRDTSPSLPSGRVLLYVCPECGDIGCGAIAVRIRRHGDQIIWDDFARENGYEEPDSIASEPIEFDAKSYWHAFDDLLAEERSNKSLERTREG